MTIVVIVTAVSFLSGASFACVGMCVMARFVDQEDAKVVVVYRGIGRAPGSENRGALDQQAQHGTGDQFPMIRAR
jgi:hypothetical protein